jgi:hypothetical protein
MRQRRPDRTPRTAADQLGPRAAVIRTAARKRRRRGKVPAWARRPLSEAEVRQLLAAQRQYHELSLYRAMGRPYEAPIYNPGGQMAVRRRRRKRRINPSRARRIREAQRRAGQLSLRFRRSRGGNGGGQQRPRMLRPRPAPRGYISPARGYASVAGLAPVRGLLGPVGGGGGGAMVLYTPPGGLRATAGRPRRRRRAPLRRARFRVGERSATVVRRARRRRGLPPWLAPPPNAGGRAEAIPTRRKPGRKRRAHPAPTQRATPATKPGSKRRARPAPRPRPRARLGSKIISAAKYQGRARAPKLFAERLAAAKRRKARGQKNVWAIRTIRRRQRIAGLVRRNPHHAGGSSMAKHHRRRRRRNPALDIKGMIKSLIATGIPAAAGGAAASLLDSKVLAKQSMGVRYAAKVGVALAAAMLLKSRPAMAAAAMAGVLGAVGYDLGTRVGGPASTMAQIAYLVSADRQAMSALVDASGNLQTTPSLSGMSGSGMAGPNDVVLG